jgi:hypothetical protein
MLPEKHAAERGQLAGRWIEHPDDLTSPDDFTVVD